MFQDHAKGFTRIVSFSNYNNFIREVSLVPFYKWGN